MQWTPLWTPNESHSLIPGFLNKKKSTSICFRSLYKVLTNKCLSVEMYSMIRWDEKTQSSSEARRKTLTSAFHTIWVISIKMPKIDILIKFHMWHKEQRSLETWMCKKNLGVFPVFSSTVDPVHTLGSDSCFWKGHVIWLYIVMSCSPFMYNHEEQWKKICIQITDIQVLRVLIDVWVHVYKSQLLNSLGAGLHTSSNVTSQNIFNSTNQTTFYFQGL